MRHLLLTLRSVGRSLAWAALVACLASTAQAQQIRLLHEKSDPYGCPRPASGEVHVPVGTSFFTEKETTDRMLSDSLTVRIGPRDDAQFDLLMPGDRFADGCSGRILPGPKGKPSLIIQIDGLRSAAAPTGPSLTSTPNRSSVTSLETNASSNNQQVIPYEH